MGGSRQSHSLSRCALIAFIKIIVRRLDAAMSENNKIVKFNVGGTRYEVARSLLASHPDTLLARMASEQWQKDPESEIFIERDGLHLRYCLSYPREGRVLLPVSVSRESVLEDMTYYGIEVSDDEYVAFGENDDVARKILFRSFEEVQKDLIEIDKDIAAVVAKKIFLLFTREFFKFVVGNALASSSDGKLPATTLIRNSGSVEEKDLFMIGGNVERY